MRRQLLLATVGLLSIVRAPLHADNLILEVFGKYIESLRAQTGIPGLSGALVGLDGIIWEQAFGYQDVEQSIAARPDTPYHVDGLTELFTSSLVLRCVEEATYNELMDAQIEAAKKTGSDDLAKLMAGPDPWEVS